MFYESVIMQCLFVCNMKSAMNYDSCVDSTHYSTIVIDHT